MAASKAGISAGGNTADREIVCTRVYDAPVELVWKAWTRPESITNWWGPYGFKTTTSEMDVRPGGVWRHVMHGPDGREYPNEIIYVEVVKHERMVYDHVSPPVFRTTATFTAQGNKTELCMHMVFESAALRDRVVKEHGAAEGLQQTMARLVDELAKLGAAENRGESNFGERTVVITREFDAPRELVFKAWTEPKHLAQWWGPKGFTNPVCELDVRVGGAWHIVMRAPNGDEYPGGGVYREVVPPERLVFTNDAVDKEGKAIIKGLTKLTFEERGGKTLLTLETTGVAVVEYAAAYLKGMEQGWTMSLEKLAAFVAKG
jgi:uncharacterized protein YndB with AHSA1/START domain